MAVHHIATPFDFHKAVTLHDTDDNLITPQRALFIANIGTSGSVMIRQGNHADAPVWLNQGESTWVGRDWRGAKSTGATAGLSLVAFF